MKDRFYRSIKIPVILITLYIVLFFGCKNKEPDNYETTKVNNEREENKTLVKDEEYAVEPPPFSDGIFPCKDCHANFPPNPVRRNW